MSKNNSYWIKREKERLKENLKAVDVSLDKINKNLDKAAKDIEDEILKLYGRYAKDNELTYQMAKEMLNSKEYSKWRMDLKEYVKQINKSGGNPELLLELNTLSTKSQISRLEESLYQIQKILDEDYIFKHKEVEELLKKGVKDNFIQTGFDIYKHLGFHASFSSITKKDITDVLSLPWSGTHYSKRLWNNRTKLKNVIEEQITQSIIQGKDLRKVIKTVSDTMEVSKNVVKRLVNTEHAYACSQGDMLMYKELGVEEYEYIATLDYKTSDICREHDGKVYRLDEAVVGVNFPPLHPHCRSTTIIADVDRLNDSTRIARDKDGNNIYLKSGVGYNDYRALKSGDWSRARVYETGNDVYYGKSDVKKYKILNEEDIESYQNQSDKIYKIFSKHEREALSEYTQGGYDVINGELASGGQSEYEEKLNQAIDKFNLKEDIITYRGTNEKYYLDYQVGDIFEGKVFYSTSLNYEQAVAFAEDHTIYDEEGYKGILIEIKVPKNSKALYIGKNTDYRPDEYTVNEYELLLSNKTKYQVKKIDDGKIILEVDQ